MRQWMIDAFASLPFRGNPACVVEPFEAWPEAVWMQALATENNQAETAFLLKTGEPGRFGLRFWERPLVRLAGALADRVMLRSGPAVQSCRRLGLPEDRLDRDQAGALFEDLAQQAGLVGVTARFAKARLILAFGR